MMRSSEALRSRRTDEGFSLVEMVVALAILALVSTGIAAGTGAVVKMTAETRARQIAVNLAEAKLDEDRGILDPFKIFAGTSSQVVGNRTYTLVQDTSLVSDDGSDITCGSGKTIYYRRISVTVRWTGMLATTSPVQSDTVLSPNGRINDSSTGSIAVRVTGSSGLGQPAVPVTITPNTGSALPLQKQPDATDAEGCSYALGVAPGAYTVKIQRSGWVDTGQASVPTNATVAVVAGRTTSVVFEYADAMDYSLTYAGGTSPVLPANLPVTFLTPTATPYITPSDAAPPTTVSLYPYPAGYTAIAGAAADSNGKPTCASQDPAAWQAGTYDGVTVGQGMRSTPVAATAGGSASLDVPMGTFRVNQLSALYLTAVAQNDTTNGQPGCAKPATFTFSTLSLGSSVLALPYGTYKIYSGGLLGALTTAITSNGTIKPITTGHDGELSTFLPASGTLVLDPRPRT